MSDAASPLDMNDRKTRLKVKMTEARQELVKVFNTITPENMNRPTANEGWSAYDVACHIAGAEGGMEVIAQRTLVGQPSMVEGFDIHRFNSGGIRKRKERAIPELIAELDQSRARMFALLESTTDEQLSLPVEHPTVGKIDLYGLFVVIYRHELQHANEIKEAIQGIGVGG